VPDERAAGWAEVGRLFHAARERAPSERAAYLRAACADDAVRARVESLLASDAEADGFLEWPDEDPTGAPSARPGNAIGAYRLVEELGEGGMGTVYLAVRGDDAFEKRVAVKLIRPGLVSRGQLARFARERSIAARMEHPNIAMLLDGGTTAAGQPYFVMEHVEGRPIDRYCEEEGLSVRARLELFRRLCAAVHHAHQNLVVHRDLKPGNVLVTRDGEPKLLDFGIAKPLDADGADATVSVPLMTPDYASPEQLEGRPVTTATDVWSLGVVLYELLCGERPFRRGGAPTPAGLGDEPTRPSAVLRATDPTTRRLRRQLAGDLDNIVLKALRREPERRYGSVQALAEDVGRHLAGHAVLARPDTWSYRLAKLVGRNRGAAAATGLALLALVGGTAVAIRQARVAEARRLEAEERSDDLLALARVAVFEVDDRLAVLSGTTTVRELLASAVRDLLSVLESGGPADAERTRTLAGAYERVANTRWNRYYGHTGDPRGALADQRRAFELRTELVASGGATPDDLHDLAESHMLLGDVAVELRRLDEALEHYRASLAITEEALAAAPGNARLRESLATRHQRLGDHLGNPDFLNAEDFGASEHHYAVMMELLAELVAERPDDLNRRHSLGHGHHKLGDLAAARGELADAREHYLRSLELYRSTSAAAPANVRFRRDVAVGHGRLGDYALGLRAFEEALEHYSEMHAIRSDLAERDPENVGLRADLARSHRSLSRLYGLMDEPEARAEHDREYLHLRLALVDPVTGEVRREDLADARWMAERLREEGLLEEACELLRESAAVQRANGSGVQAVQTRRDLAMHLGRLVDFVVELGDTDEARALCEERLALSAELADRPHADPLDLFLHASELLSSPAKDLRDPARALTYAERAHELVPGGDHLVTLTLAKACFETGDLERAVELQVEALQQLPASETRAGPHYVNLLETYRAALAASRDGNQRPDGVPAPERPAR